MSSIRVKEEVVANIFLKEVFSVTTFVRFQKIALYKKYNSLIIFIIQRFYVVLTVYRMKLLISKPCSLCIYICIGMINLTLETFIQAVPLIAIAAHRMLHRVNGIYRKIIKGGKLEK